MGSLHPRHPALGTRQQRKENCISKPNLARMMAQYRNWVATALKEAGRTDLGNSYTLTWSWCSNPHFPSQRYKFINLDNNETRDH